MKALAKYILIFSIASALSSCVSNLSTNKRVTSVDLYIMPISGFTRFNIDSVNIKSLCTVTKTINKNNELLKNIEEWMHGAKTSGVDSFSYDHIRSMIVFNRRKSMASTMQVDASGKILWKNKVYILDKKALYLILEPLSDEQRGNIIKRMPMRQWR